MSGRRYTSYAQWKFREFNELPHLFVRRLHESYPLANTYIGQFPNENMTLIMRFVAFVSGAFAAVLFLATLWDPDIFLHLEITPHRTVLFYLGVFGGVLTVARGMIPEENRVFDPEMLMTGVISYTHYMPDQWKDQLHSKRVSVFEWCSFFTADTNPSRPGASRIRGTLCDEDTDIRRGAAFRRPHSVHPVAFVTSVCTCHHRLFPGVHRTRRWSRLCV